MNIAKQILVMMARQTTVAAVVIAASRARRRAEVEMDRAKALDETAVTLRALFDGVLAGLRGDTPRSVAE